MKVAYIVPSLQATGPIIVVNNLVRYLKDIVEKVDVIEDSIDITTHEFSLNQLRRLRDKKCTPEHSALYTETLIDFERIGDHGLNIAVAFDEIKDDLTEMA